LRIQSVIACTNNLKWLPLGAFIDSGATGLQIADAWGLIDNGQRRQDVAALLNVDQTTFFPRVGLTVTKVLTMDYQERLLRVLDKDVLTENLAKAGLYSLAFQMLQDSIIQRPEGFFTMGEPTKQSYKTKVLDLNPDSKLFASCRWWQQQGVLTEQDIQEFRQLRQHRNEIVHALPNVLLNPDIQVDERKLTTIYQLLCKIDRWWIMEIEIPTNEDFEGQDIDAPGWRSLNMEFLSYLIGALYQPSEQQQDDAT